MVRFIPREERFFDCFERQAAYLVDASRRLHDLVYVFSDQAAKALAIKGLRRLDPGFHAIAVAVNTLENRADQLLRQSLAALFDTAPDAIHVLKWKDIYETMEAVTDRCEDVANVVEAILLKMT